MGLAPPPPGSRQAVVLVVDDQPECLRALAELLRPAYRVLAARSGADALAAAIADPRPDLILLDVEMPGMDGYAVLARLRGQAETRDIPVVFVIAMDATAEVARGLDCGAADYLAKPLSPPVVLARVRVQVELQRARDGLRRQNALLEAEAARCLEAIRLAQDVSIHALARLAEARDLATGNHLRRTQQYIHLLADSLRGHPRFAAFLTPGNIKTLVLSALLHDIGKIGIPDHILLKPGKLDAAERAIMETHAKLGSDAIEAAIRDAAQPIEFLSMGRDIARYHHEKWNGGGYPEGLAGDAIPIPARLMAVADVFDALICRRAYKGSWSFSEARDLIASERGRHFDPDVVDAFLGRFGEFAAIAERYADQAAAIRRPDAPADGGGA